VEVLFGKPGRSPGSESSQGSQPPGRERTVPFGLLCVSLIVCWCATHGQPAADLAARRASAPGTAASTAPSAVLAVHTTK
jgi:hypothetical protein